MQGIQRHKESFFITPFWIVFLVVVLIFLAISVVKIHRKYSHAKNIRDDFRDELVKTKELQSDLQKNIDALSTDRGKEAEIRDRYRVVKDGEQMILIIDNTEKTGKKP